jgi:RHS repeat-associated protein
MRSVLSVLRARTFSTSAFATLRSGQAPVVLVSISVDWTDANLDGTFAAGERTGSVEYLIENSNFTGYQQTILEVTKNAAGQATKRISYTFGTDEITQTVSIIDPSSQLITQSSTLTFAHDGKGSVRALFGAAATIAQVYTYSAYGELLAIHNSAGTLQPLTSSLTSVLYNGEGLDARKGLYNMRARWYSASNARWERLDPFNGNPSDPFSFNKYGFVHGDPVQGIDPTGMARKDGAGQSLLDPFHGDNFFAKVGRAAHEAIQRDYDKWAGRHGKVVQTNSTHPHFLGVVIPDLVNFSDSMIGEIKPNSANGLARGVTQLTAAISIANGLTTFYGGWQWYDGAPLPNAQGVVAKWRGETWAPGIAGIQAYWLGNVDPTLYKEVVVTLGNWNGLIVYHRVKMQGRELPRVAMERATQIAKEVVESIRLNNHGFPTIEERMMIDLLLAQRLAAAGLIATGAAAAFAYGPSMLSGLAGMMGVASMNARMGFAL